MLPRLQRNSITASKCCACPEVQLTFRTFVRNLARDRGARMTATDFDKLSACQNEPCVRLDRPNKTDTGKRLQACRARHLKMTTSAQTAMAPQRKHATFQNTACVAKRHAAPQKLGFIWAHAQRKQRIASASHALTHLSLPKRRCNFRHLRTLATGDCLQTRTQRHLMLTLMPLSRTGSLLLRTRKKHAQICCLCPHFAKSINLTR